MVESPVQCFCEERWLLTVITLNGSLLSLNTDLSYSWLLNSINIPSKSKFRIFDVNVKEIRCYACEIAIIIIINKIAKYSNSHQKPCWSKITVLTGFLPIWSHIQFVRPRALIKFLSGELLLLLNPSTHGLGQLALISL